MNLTDLQREVSEWTVKNFDNRKEHHPLLGLMEEVGELSHAHLKAEQGIRTGEGHHAAKIDAVGDIVIFLADYCTTQGISLEGAVRNTWNEVKERDWKKNKEGVIEKKCNTPSCSVCSSLKRFPMRYHLQNKYQDSGWENLPDELFDCANSAVERARELSNNAICYGMVRVLDMKAVRVVVTYPAGG